MDTLLVFGARNLGRVLARELAAEGWRVAAVARTESTIEQLRDEVPDAIGLIGDASKPEDVERVFADVGDVDLVVNAITTTPSFGGPIHEAPPDALDGYVGALLPGIFNVLRVGAKHGEFVTDEIVDRFCVLGNVADATKKLKELESIGVDQFNIYLMTKGQEETLKAYGDEIIPQFTGVAA